LPSDDEWTTLENYLIANGYNYDGTTTGNKIAKSLASTSGWTSSSTTGVVGNTDYPSKRNATGFTALPGGYRNVSGSFSYIGTNGFWRSATEGNPTLVWFRNLSTGGSNLFRSNDDKEYGFSVRCVRSEPPFGETKAATLCTSTSVTLNGEINTGRRSTIVTFEYGSTTSYGSEITAVQSPVSSSTLVDVSANLTSLEPATTYHYRLKAVNSDGTVYANDMTFTTPARVIDADLNEYNTVIIGTQTWMQENLKTTKYNDNTEIPLVTDNTEWFNLTTPGYCWYGNDETSNKNVYGALYNWYALNTGKLCPVGWHVPTNEEWTVLVTYLNGPDVAGGKLKETGTTHWQDPNTGATNEAGFIALPGGYRSYNTGVFDLVGINGFWWGSIISYWNIAYNHSMVGHQLYEESGGFSVRCVKN
jgi:uncharacterized protein (TIGR02145 family)